MSVSGAADDHAAGVACMWMRGGTSKGAYFLESDLPEHRDAFLLRVMGSPDARQIDGIGGADPLTSKVAVVKPSNRAGVDVDYLFLQVSVDEARVSDAQNCGNILAGVGPFAIERGLVSARGDTTRVSIFMENTGKQAVATVQTPNGRPDYSGDVRIDGVPGTAASVPIAFSDTAGSSCGALLPSGQVVDVVDGVSVTMIDNGMPVVILPMSAFGLKGDESREDLDANVELKSRLESIRQQCGPRMNLGDVRDKTVPKMSLVGPPLSGGCVSTRTFIPHRCHASIGVLGAASVASACLLPGSPAHAVAVVGESLHQTLAVEHPIGSLAVEIVRRDNGEFESVAIVRTARKLFDGCVFD